MKSGSLLFASHVNHFKRVDLFLRLSVLGILSLGSNQSSVCLAFADGLRCMVFPSAICQVFGQIWLSLWKSGLVLATSCHHARAKGQKPGLCVGCQRKAFSFYFRLLIFVAGQSSPTVFLCNQPGARIQWWWVGCAVTDCLWLIEKGWLCISWKSCRLMASLALHGLRWLVPTQRYHLSVMS